MRTSALSLLLLSGCTLAVLPPESTTVTTASVSTAAPRSAPDVPVLLRSCTPSPRPPQGTRTIAAIAQWAQAVEASKQDCIRRHDALLRWIDRNME